MAFSSNSRGGPMADINVTPLVDVMLVLLIIFMVTAPILSYPIQVDLPQRSPNKPQNPKEPPPDINLRIDASGTVYWNNTPVPIDSLQRQMVEAVQADPTNQPMLKIDANDDSQYETLARVLAAAKNAQMQKIGFIEGL